MPQGATKTATPPPIPQTPTVTVPGSDGKPIAIPIPVTQNDVDALLSRRGELGTQMNSANSRRNELSRSLRNARPGPDQAGIETRISQLDARIMSIESEMAGVGRALSAAPSGLQQTTSSIAPSPRYGPFSSNQVTAISVLSIIFVAAPLVISMGVIAIRRAAHPPAP